jgi:hypothetical protein
MAVQVSKRPGELGTPGQVLSGAIQKLAIDLRHIILHVQIPPFIPS